MLFSSLSSLIVASASLVTAAKIVNETTCSGRKYTYRELAGYGTVAGNARDEFGDTINFGSSAVLDRKQWRKLSNGSYTGVLWSVPDRGWNTEGTLNFQPRVHKYNILFTPNTTATIENPSGKNIHFWYQETIRFYGPDGQPATGLDADANGYLTYPGYPPLPAATYPGDGFGGPGPGGKRVSVDVEGLVIDARDGSFWISDEYGPYLYHFDSVGKMIGAIQPPAAYLPLRNGSLSFSSNNPPYYDQDRKLNPVDGPSGRMNNRGLEGLTIDGSGRNLYALMQGALNQEGGLTKQTERHARLLKYDITVASKPRYAREYVVPLPYWIDPTSKSAAKARKVAAQSEILHVQNGQFFVLARDSGSGHGADQTTSQYRHIDIFDINSATDIKSAKYDCSNCSIASVEGVLKPEITAATYCPFIDFNINSQLNRFGVHNGGNQDAGLLNEKWESLAIVPVDGKVGDDDEWFVLAISDNDFITQDGYLKDGEYRYTDSSGYNLDNQALMFHIKLPDHSRPFDRKNGGWV